MRFAVVVRAETLDLDEPAQRGRSARSRLRCGYQIDRRRHRITAARPAPLRSRVAGSGASPVVWGVSSTHWDVPPSYVPKASIRPLLLMLIASVMSQPVVTRGVRSRVPSAESQIQASGRTRARGDCWSSLWKRNGIRPVHDDRGLPRCTIRNDGFGNVTVVNRSTSLRNPAKGLAATARARWLFECHNRRRAE
jgi:hypothetical protein